MIVGVAVATVMSVAGTEMLVVVGNTAVVWLQYRCQKMSLHAFSKISGLLIISSKLI